MPKGNEAARQPRGPDTGRQAPEGSEAASRASSEPSLAAKHGVPDRCLRGKDAARPPGVIDPPKQRRRKRSGAWGASGKGNEGGGEGAESGGREGGRERGGSEGGRRRREVGKGVRAREMGRGGEGRGRGGKGRRQGRKEAGREGGREGGRACGRAGGRAKQKTSVHQVHYVLS